MKKYKDMSKDELLTLKAALLEEYKEEQAKGLSLNMARGKFLYLKWSAAIWL